VFFVALDSIREAELVGPAMAQALGVQESGGLAVEESLKGYLRGRQVLIVLDNFEQVLAAAPLVGRLLAACPGVKVVVTSRSPLRVYGEQEFPVPPLAVPAGAAVTAPVATGVAGYGAVALFVERARAVRPGFALSDENAAAVAEICTRLDGLPLAIELAAARIKLFSPQALLARLDSTLQMLTGGARDLPARQQTLRGAIDWSYSLLDEGEKGLFARLAVFVGNYGLEAVEAVIGDWRLEIGDLPLANRQSPISILDGVSSLLDKSLLKMREGMDGEARFFMLETIHAYALERLAERGEVAALQGRHADYYLAIAEEAGPALLGAGQPEALQQLEREHDNLRAALRWALDGGEVELAVRFASALWRFWHARSYLSEGRNWLRAVRAVVEGEEKSEEGGAWSVERDSGELGGTQGNSGELKSEEKGARRELPVGLLANVYNGSGVLAYYQGDYEQARQHYEQCLGLRRDMEDVRGVAAALNNLGLIAYDQGEYERATAVFGESLDLFRQMDYQRGIAAALDNLGLIAYGLGDYERATALCTESLGLRRTIGDKQWVAITLNLLGNIAWGQGEYGRAAELHEQGLGLFQELGDRVGAARALSNLGRDALSQGQDGAALAYYGDSLRLLLEVRDRQGSIQGMEGLAGALARRGRVEEAACLLGAAEGLRQVSRLILPPSERPGFEQVAAAVRAGLDEGTLRRNWEKGTGMTLAEALGFGLEAAGGGRW
jgi:predicted ATPase